MFFSNCLPISGSAPQTLHCQPLSWQRFCHADSLLGPMPGELILAPFERWGPESSFEILGYLRGPIIAPDWAIANCEVSLFPHRRTPYVW